jgi:hypothetical protein
MLDTEDKYIAFHTTVYLKCAAVIIVSYLIEKFLFSPFTALISVCLQCCEKPQPRSAFSNDIYMEIGDLDKEITRTVELKEKIEIALRR